MSYIILGLVLFIAFSIGLNLGLHGVINVHNTGQVVSQGEPTKQQRANTDLRQGIKDVIVGKDEVPIENVSPAKPHTPQQQQTHVKSDIGWASKSSYPQPSKSQRKSHQQQQQQQQAVASASLMSSSTPQTPQAHHEDVRNARVLVDEACSVQTYMDVVQHTSASLENEKLHLSNRDDISSYIDKGGKIPVVMMTCNRANLLKTTLASLFSVRGIVRENVLVLQDGKNREVEAVVRDHNLQLVQHDPSQLRYADGATRIAKHYKYSLTAAFDHFPLAPAIIIVEDDLLFSPDFLDYFEQVAPILDVDATSFLVSAWSDNGYKGKVDDPYALRRTEFFPGLGWLLPRKLYKQELEDKWPSEHWDHWLRSYPINRGREIIYPQVPRTYHNGIRGTFMDTGTHNRYFRDIAYNQDKHITWKKHVGVSLSGATVKSTPLEDKTPIYAQAVEAVYETRIEALVSKCTHLRAAEDLSSTHGIICIWLDVAPEGKAGRLPPFEPLAKFFGIWHEHSRGVHRGLHEFYYGTGASRYILVLNVFGHDRGGGTGRIKGGRTYKYLKPDEARFLQPTEFTQELKHSLEQAQSVQHLQTSGVKVVGARAAGLSCNQVCASETGEGEEEGMACDELSLPVINSCSALQSVFSCSGGCSESLGSEQPAMVLETVAGQGHKPGLCLFSSNAAASTCNASHKYTQRACPCKRI